MAAVMCSSVRLVKAPRPSKVFGLNARRQARAVSQFKVSAYKITLIHEGEEKVIECDGDTYILDAADDAGVDLPYSCRSE